EIALRIRAHDAQLLDRRSFIAHMTGHAHALVDTPGRGARSDRARLAMMVGAVRLGSAMKVVALDVAGEALALGDTRHVDELARLKEADVELLADLVVVDARDSEFPNGGDLRQVLEL